MTNEKTFEYKVKYIMWQFQEPYESSYHKNMIDEIIKLHTKEIKFLESKIDKRFLDIYYNDSKEMIELREIIKLCESRIKELQTEVERLK